MSGIWMMMMMMMMTKPYLRRAGEIAGFMS